MIVSIRYDKRIGEFTVRRYNPRSITHTNTLNKKEKEFCKNSLKVYEDNSYVIWN